MRVVDQYPIPSSNLSQASQQAAFSNQWPMEHMIEVDDGEPHLSDDRFRYFTVDCGPFVGTCTFTVPCRYRNLKFLANGPYGSVATAEDAVSGAKVAIKRLRSDFGFAADGCGLRLSYREIVLFSSIKHANVIPIMSMFSPDQSNEDLSEVYLVMELMPATLHTVIHTAVGNFSLKWISFALYQLLCAVNHLHKLDVIHRDLKPGNIAVNSNTTLKLLDFGLAMVHTPNSLYSPYITTSPYRAPEIIVRKHHGDKADVWSIGCIFGEMATRKILFNGRDERGQMPKILNFYGIPQDRCDDALSSLHADCKVDGLFERILPEDRFPEIMENSNAKFTVTDARDIMRKMLAIDPDQRCSVAQALKHPFVKIWFDEEQVNAPLTPSRYDPDYDQHDYDRQQWNKFIFDYVKTFEKVNNPFA